jgi:hypothetical protein
MHEITADDGSTMEVWYARELQSVCGYARWENFAVAINRAKESCKSQKISIEDHFRDVTKMVSLGSGSEREIDENYAQKVAEIENKKKNAFKEVEDQFNRVIQMYTESLSTTKKKLDEGYRAIIENLKK